MKPHLDQLWMLQDLEINLEVFQASTLQDKLRQFTSSLLLFSVEELWSFHSLTTAFERFTAYLVLRSCRGAFLMPESWADIHLSWFAHAVQSGGDVPNLDREIYAKSLVMLIRCFCQLVARVGPQLGPSLRLGVKTYPSRLLHRRNTELLALGMANLGLADVGIEALQEMRESACEVCRSHLI